MTFNIYYVNENLLFGAAALERQKKVNSMRKLFLGAVLAAVSSSLAMAADLPAKSAPAPVPASQPLWKNGFYVGLNAGVGHGTNKQDISQGRWEGDEYPAVQGNGTNILLGGQAGYNYFFGDKFIGVEGDLAFANYKNITAGAPYYSPSNPEQSQAAVGQKVDMLGTLRLRGGMLFDRTLVYATGGLAVTNGNVILKDGSDHPTGNTDNLTAYGWVVGVGAEYAIDRNWSLKGEYLHINTRGNAHTYSDVEDETYRAKNTFTNDLVRLGVNYRF